MLGLNVVQISHFSFPNHQLKSQVNVPLTIFKNNNAEVFVKIVNLWKTFLYFYIHLNSDNWTTDLPVQDYNKFQSKLWQKFEPRLVTKLSMSTLAKAKAKAMQGRGKKIESNVSHNVETNPFILPSCNKNSKQWRHNDIVSLTLSVCFTVIRMKTSSLSDHTSKVTANNGALSKLIHAQGMDWQWKTPASHLFKATHLFPHHSVHNQTVAFHCHKRINTAFVLVWHLCLDFYKDFSTLAQKHFCLVFCLFFKNSLWFYFVLCTFTKLHHVTLKTERTICNWNL